MARPSVASHLATGTSAPRLSTPPQRPLEITPAVLNDEELLHSLLQGLGAQLLMDRIHAGCCPWLQGPDFEGLRSKLHYLAISVVPPSLYPPRHAVPAWPGPPPPPPPRLPPGPPPLLSPQSERQALRSRSPQRSNLQQTSQSHQRSGGKARGQKPPEMPPKGAQPSLTSVLKDVRGHAKTQKGCDVLKEALQVCSNDDLKAIFDAVLVDVTSLSVDNFGSQVVQALIDKISPDEASRVLDTMAGHFEELAKDKHGCRVLQKMQEMFPEDANDRLEAALDGKALFNCIQSPNGNHVIQMILRHATPLCVERTIAALEDNIETWAKDQYGCRILQRLFERSETLGLLDLLKAVHHQLIDSAVELCQDKFGNYVVQSLLEHCVFEDLQRLCEVIRDNVVLLAKGKCSSVVVDKCIEFLNAEQGDEARLIEGSALTHRIMETEVDGQYIVEELMKSKFGIFTVARLITHCNQHDDEVVRNRMSQLLDQVQESAHKKILTALKDKYGM